MINQFPFIVTAPTRVDLAGGTLDLWPLYCIHPHAITLNAALDLKIQVDVTATPKTQFSIEIVVNKRHKITKPMTTEEIGRLSVDLRFPSFLVSCFLERLTVLPNVSYQFQIQSPVPLGSGLGGSSALAVALTKALGECFGGFSDGGWQWRCLEWVRDVEAGYLGLPTGSQDYLAAIFGGLRAYTFSYGNTVEKSFNPSIVQGFSDRMLVLFSGESHQSGLSNWEVFKKRLEGDLELENGFTRISEISQTLGKELSKSHPDWSFVGKLMSEEWQVRRETFQVHTERIDQLVDYLQKEKVLGVKVCGAAQGGSLLVLVEPKQKNDLLGKLQSKKIQVLPAAVSLNGVQVFPPTPL